MNPQTRNYSTRLRNGFIIANNSNKDHRREHQQAPTVELQENTIRSNLISQTTHKHTGTSHSIRLYRRAFETNYPLEMNPDPTPIIQIWIQMPSDQQQQSKLSR